MFCFRVVLFCLLVPNELNTFVYLFLCLFCARIFFHSFLMSVYNNSAFLVQISIFTVAA